MFDLNGILPRILFQALTSRSSKDLFVLEDPMTFCDFLFKKQWLWDNPLKLSYLMHLQLFMFNIFWSCWQGSLFSFFSESHTFYWKVEGRCKWHVTFTMFICSDILFRFLLGSCFIYIKFLEVLRDVHFFTVCGTVP